MYYMHTCTSLTWIFLSTTGFDKSTVSTTVQRVTNALAARADTFIKWPSSPTQKSSIKTGFYLAAGFPNVIGCIDGTHVRIQAPSVDENAFVNRKGYHSINVQGVCDHEGLQFVYQFEFQKPLTSLKTHMHCFNYLELTIFMHLHLHLNI